MSRIHLNIDRLVLNGLGRGEAAALAETLRKQLSEILADPATRAQWARSHRTPLLKLGRMPLESGNAGARKFGARMAGAVGKGLKP